MSSPTYSDEKINSVYKLESNSVVNEDRRKLERKLVRTLDLRMTMLGAIFALNYVSFPFDTSVSVLTTAQIDRTNVA